MDEEDAIKRATSLLEKGATMLASHHDCGAPLFRYGGRVICPACSFDESGELIGKESSERASQAVPPPSGSGDESADETAPGVGHGPTGAGDEDAAAKAFSSSIVLGGEPGRPRVSEGPGEERADSQIYVGDRDGPLVRELEGELAEIICQRLRDLGAEVRTERDLFRLKQLLECMEVALRTVRSMHRRG